MAALLATGGRLEVEGPVGGDVVDVDVVVDVGPGAAETGLGLLPGGEGAEVVLVSDLVAIEGDLDIDLGIGRQARRRVVTVAEPLVVVGDVVTLVGVEDDPLEVLGVHLGRPGGHIVSTLGELVVTGVDLRPPDRVGLVVDDRGDRQGEVGRHRRVDQLDRQDDGVVVGAAVAGVVLAVLFGPDRGVVVVAVDGGAVAVAVRVHEAVAGVGGGILAVAVLVDPVVGDLLGAGVDGGVVVVAVDAGAVAVAVAVGALVATVGVAAAVGVRVGSAVVAVGALFAGVRVGSAEVHGGAASGESQHGAGEQGEAEVPHGIAPSVDVTPQCRIALGSRKVSGRKTHKNLPAYISNGFNLERT